MEMAFGNGGWVRVAYGALPGPLYVRLTEQASGHYAASEIYLDGRGLRIRGDVLRNMPLAEIEAVAAPDIGARAAVAGIDLSRLATYYGTTYGPKATGWVADSMRAQDPTSGVRQVQRQKHVARRDVASASPPLSAPDAGLTDEFLVRVADAYREAVRRGEWPAPSLAKQAGVAPKTVQKWVYIARKRGLMPRGKQGMVG